MHHWIGYSNSKQLWRSFYKAYHSVHSLSLIAQSKESENRNGNPVQLESNQYIQSMVSVGMHHWIVYSISKQLFGNQPTMHLILSSIQSKTIEDSLFTWHRPSFCFMSNSFISELLHISRLLRTNLRFCRSGICDKGFSSLAFAVLLITKTWNSRPKNLWIGPQFQGFLLNWPEICSIGTPGQMRPYCSKNGCAFHIPLCWH
jgi:hypothetical protein